MEAGEYYSNHTACPQGFVYSTEEQTEKEDTRSGISTGNDQSLPGVYREVSAPPHPPPTPSSILTLYISWRPGPLLSSLQSRNSIGLVFTGQLAPSFFPDVILPFLWRIPSLFICSMYSSVIWGSCLNAWFRLRQSLHHLHLDSYNSQSERINKACWTSSLELYG